MQRALSLVEAAADGAADEDVTPAGIAGELEAALAALPATHPARRRLLEALDGVADGMPGDYVARILYSALRDLEAR